MFAGLERPNGVPPRTEIPTIPVPRLPVRLSNLSTPSRNYRCRRRRSGSHPRWRWSYSLSVESRRIRSPTAARVIPGDDDIRRGGSPSTTSTSSTVPDCGTALGRHLERVRPRLEMKIVVSGRIRPRGSASVTGGDVGGRHRVVGLRRNLAGDGSRFTFDGKFDVAARGSARRSSSAVIVFEKYPSAANSTDGVCE